MISMIDYLFEGKEEKKDPTKLHWAEKTAGGAAIAGGLGAGAVGHSYKRVAEIQKEINDRELNSALGDKNTILGKLRRESWEISPDKAGFDEKQNKIETIRKLGKSFGDTGLGVAGTAAAGLAAHKLYKMYKNKKK